eukprot:1145112-Pelagomonas_calceolata.AAC.4
MATEHAWYIARLLCCVFPYAPNFTHSLITTRNYGENQAHADPLPVHPPPLPRCTNPSRNAGAAGALSGCPTSCPPLTNTNVCTGQQARMAAGSAHIAGRERMPWLAHTKHWHPLLACMGCALQMGFATACLHGTCSLIAAVKALVAPGTPSSASHKHHVQQIHDVEQGKSTTNCRKPLQL